MTLPISLMEKIASLKMVVHPKIDYLFLVTFLTPDDLVVQYEINQGSYLEYPQIKSIIQAKINLSPTQLNLVTPPIGEEFLNLSPSKLLSKIYGILVKTDCEIFLQTSKWEKDFTFTPNPNFWSQICSNTFRTTKNINLQLI